MKIKRSLLAVAVTLAASACSGDITAPDASAPASARQSAEAPVQPTTPSTSTDATTPPPEPDPGDTGAVGSGCCKS